MPAPLVLVVDDDPVALHVLSSTLDSAGFRVAEATDGQEALEKARALVPDVLVLDLLLPKLGGYQVFRTLRRDPDLSTIPTIFVTAAAHHEIPLPRSMWERILTKPIAPEELIERIRAALESTKTPDTTGGLP